MIDDQQSAQSRITVRRMTEGDLPAAKKIFQLAFGTFVGVPEPESFLEDRDYVNARWRINPLAAFTAEADGEIVGSNFASNWGTVGYFGPLTIHPDLWDQGIAQKLLEPTIETFDEWKTEHIGLFTFAHSPKHLELYRKYGFWPRFLTAFMSKPVPQGTDDEMSSSYSRLSEAEKEACLAACRELTDNVYSGLDLTTEIQALHDNDLGDTVLLWGDAGLDGIAVCHCGQGSEAGETNCLVKFGVVRGGSNAERDFNRLLDTCEVFTAAKGLLRIEAGVNLAHQEVYPIMIARGFRTDLQGVAMQRNNDAGYNRPGVYLIDDWR
jgi:GNAT superfamily N-acetyltransferase